MVAEQTRRALFGAAPGLALAVAAMPALAANKEQADFVRSMAALHPDGRRVALHALKHGMELKDLRSIRMPGGLKGKTFVLFFYRHQDDKGFSFDLRGLREGW